MVDTCDPTVACWSDDGETFVVKDPVKFEKQIIPQFFKHSKFSSFVRVSLNDEFNGDCDGDGTSHRVFCCGTNEQPKGCCDCSYCSYSQSYSHILLLSFFHSN